VTTQDGGKPYAPAAFASQEMFLVFISVRGWVDPRVIVRSEGFYANEKSTDTDTFRFVAQHLNHCATAVTVIEWFKSTNTQENWLVISEEKLFTVNCILILINEESLQRKVGYTKKIIRTHFGAADHKKEREDQLIRTTCDLRTRAAKFIEADGGIFEFVIVNCNKFTLSL